MMKRTLWWMLPGLMALLVFFTACDQTPAAEEEPARAVYYLNKSAGGRMLEYEVLALNEGTAEQQIRDTLAAMRAPVNANHTALLPDTVELRAVEVFGSTVVIRFSQGYDQLSEIERSMLNSAIVLSLQEVESIGYIRVTGERTSMVSYMNAEAVLLEDRDLRLTSFEIEVYPVDRSTGHLMAYSLHIASEREVLTPRMVLEEMLSGVLGEATPFDGRMDIRNVATDETGRLRADLYVPVEMDLQGREADLWSVVNSLCSCRGVEQVTVVLNGSVPSERGLKGCDGPLTYNAEWIG